MKKIMDLYKKYREIVSYLFWGGAAFVLFMLIIWILQTKLGWNEVIATIVDNIIVITFAFFTNKIFVFRSKSGSIAGFFREMASFFGARIFTMILNALIVWIGCDLMGYNAQSHHLPFVDDGMIVQFIAQVVVIVTNYVLSKLIVFRKPKKDKNAEETV